MGKGLWIFNRWTSLPQQTKRKPQSETFESKVKSDHHLWGSIIMMLGGWKLEQCWNSYPVSCYCLQTCSRLWSLKRPFINQLRPLYLKLRPLCIFHIRRSLVDKSAGQGNGNLLPANSCKNPDVVSSNNVPCRSVIRTMTVVLLFQMSHFFSFPAILTENDSINNEAHSFIMSRDNFFPECLWIFTMITCSPKIYNWYYL